MRIGIDATPLTVPRAGVGTYTANLIRSLARFPEDEVVPLLHREPDPSFSPELKGLEVPELRPAGRWRSNKTIWMHTSLRQRIRRGGFDVCHFTNSVAPLGCKRPYVVTIHDAGLWLYPEFHHARRILSMRPFVPHVVRRAEAVITDSHSVKKELVELLGVPPSRVRVIYPGVAAHFSTAPAPEESERVRGTYALPERFLLAVAAIEPRKNLVRLLEAYASLVAEPAARGVGLVIVGPEGWKSRPILEALARVDARLPIRVLGHVPDRTLVSLYHLAAALAFPSLYEGFGLPVVEAMTCGTPVVTSRLGALAEVAGDAAELVDPHCPNSIAAGLSRVLGDEARAGELRRRGRLRARSFTWDRAGRETRELYREVVSDTAYRACALGPSWTVRPSRDREATAAVEGAGAVSDGRVAIADGRVAVADGLTSLEQAIVRTIVYADIFDYPLTAGEVHRYLVGVGASVPDVLDALPRLVPRHLARRDGLYTLPGREALVDLRRERAAEAERLWPLAVRYGRRLARLPFVRMVAVTGSLAARNPAPGADIDYLVVTTPGRLWSCRALVILVVRAARRRGVMLCPNYFLSESALDLGERSLYSAWELAQAVPVAGSEVYARMRRHNAWMERHLPNVRDPARQAEPAVVDARREAGIVSRVVERILGSPIGDRFERWERERKVRRFTRLARHAGGEGAAFSAERCKGHFGPQAREVMELYRSRLVALEAAPSRPDPVGR